MSVVESLHIVLALAAPAFFLFFWMAALGAPLVAAVCLIASRLSGSQHPEAFARRLLRMALSCALPSIILLAAGLGLLLYRIPWLSDWLRAAPIVPALHAVAILAYCALLLVRRVRGMAQRTRRDNALPEALVLAALSAGIVWLSLALLRDAAAQARAVLAAGQEAGIGVATLVTPNLAAESQLFPATVLAGCLCAALCAAAWSLEYLLLRRDREPFGHDAFAHVMRIGARTAMRCGLLALSFVPVLWDRLTDLPAAADEARAVRVFLAGLVAAVLGACLAWAVLARSNRPVNRPVLVHASLTLVWLAMTCAASAAFLHFYAG